VVDLFQANPVGPLAIFWPYHDLIQQRILAVQVSFQAPNLYLKYSPKTGALQDCHTHHAFLPQAALQSHF
jgi:hypothetical protein